ncbi:MAG TPA: beta-phosphoglucomutase, partial [Treponemataceae bacterium]|nr:beta-phosphoglucomutase [Treponemataceae bacterium]
QKKYLEAFWKIATISIMEDSASELALHFNLFHLLQSSGRNGTTSIAAKGLTAEGYEGHYFWDTEAYICPVFTYVQPSIAKNLLEYRYSILPKAKKRAEIMSLKGALFPWRTIDGEETSAYYPAGTAQYHINADIMFALEKYLNAAGSDAFDTKKVLEMAVETARMWMSLGSFTPSRGGAFCINGVTGPDEYTACVNNNAYTNLMARNNLRFSISIVEKNTEAGVSQIEIDTWKKAAENMFVSFDSKLGVYPQDDSFMNKAEWDFENTPKEKYPLLLHYHPLVIYRHKVLKQPDLVLAQFLLSGEFTLAEKKRNFKFYEPLTTGDSSLSHCIQSIMACEIGEYEKAEIYFEKTARMDIEDIHGNTCDGIHTAAMAGSWMSLVYGFAGFRDWKGLWSFNPYLPSKWNDLSFSLALQDSILLVSMRRQNTEVIVSYTLREGSHLEFIHRNIPVSLNNGLTVSFSLKRVFKAALFDLDGVITDTAELHYLAWKRISDDAGLLFDREVNESLRGVSREESFNRILSHNNRKMEQKDCYTLIQAKNDYYVSLLDGLSSKDILPGISSLLKELKKKGIKLVLASASKNAPLVCEKLGLLSSFDVIADISAVQMSKPEPDIFLSGADLVGIWPSDCIGIEDAQAGIEAIQKAGMLSVAIGLSLQGATKTIADTSSLTVELLESCFEQ